MFSHHNSCDVVFCVDFFFFSMLGHIVHRLQTLSPVSSPKPKRRPAKSPAARRSLKEEFREIQSEPEDVAVGMVGVDKKPRSKRKIEKLRARRLEVSAPLQGSKSMGRLDGLKQVPVLVSYRFYFIYIVIPYLVIYSLITSCIIRIFAKYALRNIKFFSPLAKTTCFSPKNTCGFL